MGSPRALELLYIGAVVPDCPPYNGKAFSRAGNLAQLGLLGGLASAGLSPSTILTQRPMQAFPGGRKLFVKKRTVKLDNGHKAELIPFVNLPIFRPLIVGLYIVAALIKWALTTRRGQTRIVFTFNLTEPSGIFTLFAARLTGARAIAWINDINLPGETVPNNWMRRLDLWLHKKLLPRFDGLIVVTERIANDFAPNSRSICVDGGVRAETIRAPEDLEGLSRATTSFVIVAAGSLDEQNGIEEILGAFALLREPFYKLSIAGSGPLAEKVIQAHLKDSRIDYRGFLGHDQIQELYRSAGVLINMRLTSRVRTPYFFPSKLLEYMASGTPVITTCTGHVEEQYGNYVYMLRDETPEGLASMLRYVEELGPDLRCRKGLAAHRAMSLTGTWAARAKKVADFVQNISLTKTSS